MIARKQRYFRAGQFLFCLNQLLISLILIILINVLFVPMVMAARLAPEPLSKTTEYGLARAGVSVVRLIVSYTDSTQETTSPTNLGEIISCTGLGSVVANWSATSPAPQNTWVLTDSYLINKDLTAASCLGNNITNMKVRDVHIIMSSFYHSGQAVTFTVKAKDLDLAVCDKCGQGQFPILLGFNNTPDPEDLRAEELLPEPYMDVAPSPALPTGSPLLLQDLAATQPDRVVWQSNNAQSFETDIQQLKTYIQPVKSQDTATLEPGTPLINNNGELVSVHLNSMAVPLAISGTILEAAIPNFTGNKQNNTVHADWNTGLKQYKKDKKFVDAKQSFHKAAQANPRFQAASTFESLATADQTTSENTNNTTPPSTQSVTLLGMETWHIAVVGMLILLLLLGIMMMLVQRSRVRRRSYAGHFTPEEWAEAEKQAMIMAQQIQTQENYKAHQKASAQQQITTRQQQVPQSLPSHQIAATPTLHLPPQEKSLRANISLNQNIIQKNESGCPSCSKPISTSTTFCQHCGYNFIASEASAKLTDQVLPSPVTSARPAPPPPIEPVSVINQVIQAQHDPTNEPLKQIGPGQRLGNYRLVRRIGHGGFADVYVGEHVYLKDQVAIKLLHAELSVGMIKTFLKEAHILRDLRHPHIVRILDFGVEGNEPDLEQSLLSPKDCIPYLVMDYARGGNLRNRHPKGSQVPLATVILYVTAIAQGLQYAHNANIIHRDIKPENILVGSSNEILLTDFNIAVNLQSEHSITTQEMAGTFPYMAPEQSRGKARAASDQYALAIVAYELLCGNRPFQAENIWTLLNLHASAPPPKLREKLPMLPIAIEEVILKALAKHPQERFASIAEFATALSQASR